MMTVEAAVDEVELQRMESLNDDEVSRRRASSTLRIA
jgi:hypothetical protein